MAVELRDAPRAFDSRSVDYVRHHLCRAQAVALPQAAPDHAEIGGRGSSQVGPVCGGAEREHRVAVPLAAEEEFGVGAAGEQARVPVAPGLLHLGLEVVDRDAVGVLLAHHVEELLRRDQVCPGQRRRGLRRTRDEGRRRPAPHPVRPPGEVQRVGERDRDVVGRGSGIAGPPVEDGIARDPPALEIRQETNPTQVRPVADVPDMLHAPTIARSAPGMIGKTHLVLAPCRLR